MNELDFYQIFLILKKEKNFIKHDVLYNLISEYVFTVIQIRSLHAIFPDPEYDSLFMYLSDVSYRMINKN